MNDVFSLIFTQQFLLRALVVGTLISLCCALLGVSLVLKRFSMIGDGLSHVGFGALAIACAANVAPLYFSLPIVVVAAFMLLRMNENGKIKGDAAIALISTGALAVGVMVTSLTTGMNIDIYNYMFGSILTMTDSDVAVSVCLSLAVIILFVVYYYEIFSSSFDESFAKATGTRTGVYNMLISALTAVTIVIGMRMMGALLISSLLIFPVVISMRICKSYRKVVLTSAAVSVFCFFEGLVSSVRFEAPTGASVVCVNILMLGIFSLLGFVLSSKRGTVFSRLKLPLTMLIILASCALFALVTFTGNTMLYEKEKLSVVTTSFSPYDFTRQLAKDKCEISMLISPGEESHTFEPTPSDIRKIEQCDIFIYGGGESDEWVNSILSSVDVSEKEIIKMMDVTGAVLEEIKEGMQTQEEGEAEYDEHVWTSPINAEKIVSAIENALIIKDSANKAYYEANAKEYRALLKELDCDFKNAKLSSGNKSFVVGDRFPLKYLFDEYDLPYYAAFPGCSAQTEADPVTLSYLIGKVKSENISTVYKVDLSNGNVAYSISRETGAKVLTLYSCHNISKEDFESGETYISLMRRNLENLFAS